MNSRTRKTEILLSVILASILLLVCLLFYKKDMDAALQAVNESLAGQLYEIQNLEDYLNFADAVSQGNTFSGCRVELYTDLDFSKAEVCPVIGLSDAGAITFAGTFDGNGHTLSNMNISNPEGDAGMFADLSGVVQNLRMDNCTFDGLLTGAIAARCSGSGTAAIVNCEIYTLPGENGTTALTTDFSGNIWNCISNCMPLTGSLKKGTLEQYYLLADASTLLPVNADLTTGTSADFSTVAKALNENLSTVSGYFSDLEFVLWQSSGEIALSDESADLLRSLTAVLTIGSHSFSLNGYYSANDRCWCIALPAGYAYEDLKLTAETSGGGSEEFKRSQSEETILFTWENIYYPITFLSADNVDTLYVTLRSGKDLSYVHEHKLEEIPGMLTILDTNGGLDYEVIQGFYGHGNDSWASDKKSYNLKLDEISDLLGMGANEDYALLAGCRGNSLMSYCITTEMSNALGFAYAPEFRLVNLYVNGDYVGIYFLAEKIELDNNRVEINNLYEETWLANNLPLTSFDMESWQDEDGNAERYYYNIEKNPEDITGGYLLEADIMDYGPDESRFVSDRKVPITLKRFRYASEEEVNYIADYWQEFEDALFAEDGYNDLGRHYTEYIDVESFAMQWLIYELVEEASMSSSIYFYKESDVTGDGLLHACYPWDMEHSYAVTEYLYEIWNITEKEDTLYGFWSIFYQHDDFRQELSHVWTEKFLPVLELMLQDEVVETTDGVRNISWYEENISQLDHLENSRWQKMYPLNKCAAIREFLGIRRDVLNGVFLQ